MPSNPLSTSSQPLPIAPLRIVSAPAAHAGEQVSLYGRISAVPHQHLLDTESLHGREVEYLQLDEGYQIVIYLARPIDPCAGPLRLDGEVIAVAGGPKRPGEQKRDQDPSFREQHLKVSGWECLDRDSPESWLHELGLPGTEASRKAALVQLLLAQGKVAIPHLIAHLRDERPYGTHLTLPALNAPATQPASAPVSVPVGVGALAEELLYRLITPAYGSPHARNIKPYSASMLLVRDWPRWWQAHQQRSLAEIHKSLEPVIDAYWMTHGTVQVLDLP